MENTISKQIEGITSIITENISYTSSTVKDLFQLETYDLDNQLSKMPVSNDEWNYDKAKEEMDSLLEEELKFKRNYRNPIFTVVAGIPGSGKSSVVKDIAKNRNESIIIQFDALMEKLSIYKQIIAQAKAESDLSFSSQLKREAFLKTEFIARCLGYELLRRAVTRGCNIIFEHSSTSNEHVLLYSLIKQFGYKIEMYYKYVTIEEALKRINNNRGESRFTPAAYVEERFNKIEKLINQYKNIMTVKIIKDNTRLIIVRHGNTFGPGQIPTRVGSETDLNLVESHRGSSVGKYLKNNNLIPDVVFTSPLKRCTQTAQQALDTLEIERELLIDDTFIEINYGPDENKTEEEVMLRLGKGDIKVGQKVIDKWNEEALLPNGWNVDLDMIIKNWKNFTSRIASEYQGQTIMLVSSNGVIRLAPHITGNFKKFADEYEIKVATGSVSIFELEDGEENWKCSEWNSKPYKLYPKE